MENAMAPFFKSQKATDACQLLPTMDAEQTARYRHFRDLLDHNRAALSLMADLERTYYDNRPFTPQGVERQCDQLLIDVAAMVQALAGMTGKTYGPLAELLTNLRRKMQVSQTDDGHRSTGPFVIALGEKAATNAEATGAKAANLALIRQEISLPTPRGFAITTTAYWSFLRETGLAAQIDADLSVLSADDPAALEATGQKIRAQIMATDLPDAIGQALAMAAGSLGDNIPGHLLLAVRSSAVGEDGEISFAGQYSSVLNVPVADLSRAYKQVVASKYSASALSYRIHHGLDDRQTPMSVLVLEMVQPRLSGVLYTADPTGQDRDSIRISAVCGLGDALVGGDTAPQRTYRIEKNAFRILEKVVETDGQQPFTNDGVEQAFLRELWASACRLESHFQKPLDIEWALDSANHLFLLQARPLLLTEAPIEQTVEPEMDLAGHPLLIDGGKCAASGVAAGNVLVVPSAAMQDALAKAGPDTILVTRTASTSITPWIGKVKGLITDIGGTASHLASVAREFGVPALFDTGTATATLKDGARITLWADRARVYQGDVPELTSGQRPVKRPIFASPAHQRMQDLLDIISPLNLTDPNAAAFAPEGCQSVHDIIRFCHEMSMREMFRFGQVAGRNRNAVRLKVNIPIQLFALDLGNGLRQALTTCDEVNAHDVVCTPFRALWRGLSHPGLNWASTVAVGVHNFMSLMAGGAMPQDNSQLGGASYAFVSQDYLNLNVRFGYHFATVDALCGPDSEQNYISLHFAGGAGSYFGRSLRVQYMANVLSRLGFETTLKGDLIESSVARLDQGATEAALDQLGRLLGTSRLLDMAMNSPQQVDRLTDDFFQGRYDVLEQKREDAPAGFYLVLGNWKQAAIEDGMGILQDGSPFGTWIGSNVAQTMGRFMGKRYQELLDNIGAYYYFPLAIAKDSRMDHGCAAVMVKPVAGAIDQAAGLAFAIRDWSNYFVFRVNALEDNAILFEFKNGKRIERAIIDIPIRTGQWVHLRVETAGRLIKAFLDKQLIIECQAQRDLDGYVGLWTKADSVTTFKELEVEQAAG